MHRFLLTALIVTSLGVSACVHGPPRDGRDGRDGYDNRHEQRRDDNDNRNEHRSRDDDRRDQEHDGRN